MRKNSGFTIVELVISIALLGIVSYVVSSRFSNIESFQSDSNYDQVKYLLQLGQNTAISQKRNIYPTLNNNELSLCYTNNNPCPNNQKLSTNNTAYTINIANSSISIPTFHFDSKGNPNTGNITIVINGKNLYIEQETGFIHE